MTNRRAFFTLGLTAGLSLWGGLKARAAPDQPLLGDDGQPIRTWTAPSEIVLDQPGLIKAGGKSPDVFLYEFFDYNCPWCKKAAADIDPITTRDQNFGLRLVQFPILSLGSVQAAKIALATQATAGDSTAYALHRALLAHRGAVSGPEALAQIGRMKLDVAAIEAKADSDEIGAVLRRQSALAQALAFQATPSFVMNGTAIGGWPGTKRLTACIKNLRTCDKLQC